MSKIITVLTGAGISADSGLSTFRDKDGLWQKYDLRQLATLEAWNKNPAKVLEFYNVRRRQTAQVEPNAAHKALVKLEQIYDVIIVTQNIDDLHERAGSSTVWHLHGDITKARSEKDSDNLVHIGYKDIQLGDTASDGKQLRPHVVWFGEQVQYFRRSVERLKKTDILIVIGTSLRVFPAAGLADQVPPATDKYIIDPSKPSLPDFREWVHYKKKAVDGTPELVSELLRNHNKS